MADPASLEKTSWSNEDLNALIKDWRPRIYHFLNKLLHFRHDLAGDLTQNTCLKLMDALRAGQLQHPQRIGGFIFKTAQNVFRDHLRKVAKFPRHDSTEILAEDDKGSTRRLGEIEDPALNPEEAFAVTECIKALPPRERMAFELFRFEGLTQEEIAELLDLSQPTVSRLIRDAEASLRDCLRDKTYEETNHEND